MFFFGKADAAVLESGMGDPDSLPDRDDLTTEAVELVTEEYRQVYGLALFRLNALDQRVPIAGAAITALLGSVAAVPEPVQTVLLVAVPLSLLWLLRTTIRHAESFHDALSRIAAIEVLINKRFARPLMTFQSSHPSRGRAVGGRTGEETIETVVAAAAVLLGSCLYLAAESAGTLSMPLKWYSLFIAAVAIWLLGIRLVSHGYRYQPSRKA